MLNCQPITIYNYNNQLLFFPKRQAVQKIAPSTAHGTVQGITMGSASIRRRPNCFNLLHQLQFEQRLNRVAAGSLKASVDIVQSTVIGPYDVELLSWDVIIHGQAWESSKEFADAYKLGKTESDAAVNLLQNVPPSVVAKLTECVRSQQ